MIDLDALTRSVRGPVIRPADAAYDETRRTFNAMLDRRPVVIVQPLDTANVSTAVRWAADADLPVSVSDAARIATRTTLLDLIGPPDLVDCNRSLGV